jgi:serine/threonine protein phosphatase 1
MQQSAPAPMNLRTRSVPEGTLVYAIGDVHGCDRHLDRLHERILEDASSAGNFDRRVAIYLGDYVDRGPDSKRVVDILLDQPLEGFECHYLIGNHEAFLLDFLQDAEMGPGWLFNGGVATLESYGVSIDTSGGGLALTFDVLADIQESFMAKLPDAHRKFYETLALSKTEGDYFFVHAGIRPGVPLDEQAEDDMIWIRDEFLESSEDHGKVIVHGHTITQAPELRDNRIGIDTGAFATGILTALVLENHEFDTLQVTDKDL